eukprot:9261230-Lingulodinium_polyedra.AAC.1
MVCRPLFAIFCIAYDFVVRHYTARARARAGFWPVVRQELRVAAQVIPFAYGAFARCFDTE